MEDFLGECRRVMRYRHFSYHTKQSYLDWIEKFVRHFKRIKPQEMESEQAREYLTYLANEREVSANTQSDVQHSERRVQRDIVSVSPRSRPRAGCQHGRSRP